MDNVDALYDLFYLSFDILFLIINFLAIVWGRPEKVKMLVERGANRDLKSIEGKTALDIGEIFAFWKFYMNSLF
jgi:hypothetical protein